MNTIERKKKEAEKKGKLDCWRVMNKYVFDEKPMQIEIANTQHRLLLKSEKEHKKTMQIEVANTGTIHIIIYIQYILSN